MSFDQSKWRMYHLRYEADAQIAGASAHELLLILEEATTRQTTRALAEYEMLKVNNAN